MDELKERILKAKKKHNALILAHYYQDGEIQDIADHLGDSLYLAQMGEAAKNPVILVAGVVFMAESAKILSPEKTVLCPDLKAGCSLVDQSPYPQYLKWRQDNPAGIAVTYVNSSAEVKSITDVCCTSSNAEKVIEAIPKDRPILFGPDRNLGRYLAKKLNREMIMWPGACEVHVLFASKKLFELKTQHPDALVLAHPECDENVLQYADIIGSTSKILEAVVKGSHKKYIVATESGILYQMKKARPDVELIQAPAHGCLCNDCPYMKMNSLEKIALTLEKLEPKIELSASLIEKAQVPLKRMMAISRGEPVQWPNRFQI